MLPRSTHLAMVLVFVACGTSNADRGTAASARAESTQASVQHATVEPSSGSNPPNSNPPFNPDGYYSPKETLSLDGRQVKWIDVHTLDYYYDGKLHDLPKPVEPADIRLVIKRPNGSRDVQSECSAVRIQVDSLSIMCAKTTMGDVAIDGHFLDSGPNYSDKFGEKETELLVARVVITSNGKQVYDHIHRFVYGTGG